MREGGREGGREDVLSFLSPPPLPAAVAVVFGLVGDTSCPLLHSSKSPVVLPGIPVPPEEGGGREEGGREEGRGNMEGGREGGGRREREEEEEGGGGRVNLKT